MGNFTNINKSCLGMTVLETVFVMSISIGTMAIGAKAIQERFSRNRMELSTSYITTSLKHCRLNAIKNNHNYFMELDESNHRIRVVSDTDNDYTVDIGEETGDWIEMHNDVSFEHPEGDPVNTFDAMGFSTEKVASFSPTGVLMSDNLPSYIYLTDLMDDKYYRVKVELTGRTYIEEWNGTEWVAE